MPHFSTKFIQACYNKDKKLYHFVVYLVEMYFADFVDDILVLESNESKTCQSERKNNKYRFEQLFCISIVFLNMFFLEKHYNKTKIPSSIL